MNCINQLPPMKEKNSLPRITLILFCLVISIASYAQPTDRFYMLKAAALLQESSNLGVAVGTVTLVPGNSKFTIVSFTNTDYIIQFWLFGDATKAALYNFTAVAAPNNLRYFIIPKTDLVFYAIKIVNKCSATYGAAVLPFKYRPQFGGDFSKDVALSNLGGIRFSTRTGRLSGSFVIGIGISSVTLDSLNTNGGVLDASEKAAISFPVGLVVQFERLQIGLFTGWDRISRSDVHGWTYQAKPWFALGIGFSIFSDESAPTKAGSN